MADISQIITPDGNEYDIKDAVARASASVTIDDNTIATDKVWSSNKTSSSIEKLKNNYNSRPTTANVQFGDGYLRQFKATTSMTTGKPSSDAHIIHLAWDNNGGWDSQIALTDGSSGHIQFRGQQGGTWGSWITVIDSNTIGSQSVHYATSAGSASSATTATTASKISTSALLVRNVTHTVSNGLSNGWHLRLSVSCAYSGYTPILAIQNKWNGVAVAANIETMGVSLSGTTLSYSYYSSRSDSGNCTFNFTVLYIKN